MFKVQILGGDITSVASLRVLRTLWPLSLKAVEELATALKKQNEFVLVEGVTEYLQQNLLTSLKVQMLYVRFYQVKKKRPAYVFQLVSHANVGTL